LEDYKESVEEASKEASHSLQKLEKMKTKFEKELEKRKEL